MNIPKLRDLSHVLLGFSVAYLIGNSTAILEFPLYQKILVTPLMGAIIGASLGFWIEWYQEVFKKGKWDWCDVLRTCIGGSLGFVISAFYPDEWILILLISILPSYFILSDLFKRK